MQRLLPAVGSCRPPRMEAFGNQRGRAIARSVADIGARGKASINLPGSSFPRIPRGLERRNASMSSGLYIRASNSPRLCVAVFPRNRAAMERRGRPLARRRHGTDAIPQCSRVEVVAGVHAALAEVSVPCAGVAELHPQISNAAQVRPRFSGATAASSHPS